MRYLSEDYLEPPDIFVARRLFVGVFLPYVCQYLGFEWCRIGVFSLFFFSEIVIFFLFSYFFIKEGEIGDKIFRSKSKSDQEKQIGVMKQIHVARGIFCYSLC